MNIENRYIDKYRFCYLKLTDNYHFINIFQYQKLSMFFRISSGPNIYDMIYNMKITIFMLYNDHITKGYTISLDSNRMDVTTNVVIRYIPLDIQLRSHDLNVVY